LINHFKNVGSCLTDQEQVDGIQRLVLYLTPFHPLPNFQFSPPGNWVKFSSLHQFAESAIALLPKVDLWQLSTLNLTLNDVHHLLKLQEQLNNDSFTTWLSLESVTEFEQQEIVQMK